MTSVASSVGEVVRIIASGGYHVSASADELHTVVRILRAAQA